MPFLSFLWRHKAAVAIFILALISVIVLGVKLAQARRTAAGYVEQLEDYQVVTRLNESAFMQATAALDLKDTLIDGLNLPRNQSVAYAAEVRIIQKTRTVRVPVVERVAVVDDDLITARIEYIDGRECVDGFCKVKDAEPVVDLTYTLKPLTLDVFVTKRDGRFQTIVDTHNPDLVVELKTKIDPLAFQDQRRGFLGAGPLVRLRHYRNDFQAADMGAAVTGGYLGDRWFIAGQVQYLDGFGAGLIIGGRL